MQKRTNPLALKGDAKSESDIRQEQATREAAPAKVAPKKTAEDKPQRESSASSAPRQNTPATTSRIQRASDFSAAKSVTVKSDSTITYTASGSGVVATRNPIAVVEPEPADEWLDDTLTDETLEDEAAGDEIAADEEGEAEAADTAVDVPVADEVIEDEEPFPTLHDFELAARFSLRGRNSRKLVVGKVSRDVCRLAQLLHPDEKLSTIIENALMTRIFLENPEAFDAMAAVIEENGGRIKC
ncbi:MAG: hypothetical protein E7605_09255 [Ruminococcaceae bacterium]|nr:hypothetical protein [Oscillospiraceae bacterium]